LDHLGLGRLPSPTDATVNLHNNTPQVTRRRGTITGSGSLGARRAGSRIRCFRCDKRHVLKKCFASLETVKEARARRMKTRNRCVNCGSVDHWVDGCDWENLLYEKK
jgi:hypothetical protein